MIFDIKTRPLDDRQIDLVDYAQCSIRQKKRLCFHFVSFLFVSLVLTILNIGLGYGGDIIFDYPGY